MRDFRELKVWHKAHSLTLDVYRVTKSFPREELYGLTSQIRRAAASIGANIAEGAGKSSRADLGRYLQIALGSASDWSITFYCRAIWVTWFLKFTSSSRNGWSKQRRC
jgi:hypothetical protein